MINWFVTTCSAQPRYFTSAVVNLMGSSPLWRKKFFKRKQNIFHLRFHWMDRKPLNGSTTEIASLFVDRSLLVLKVLPLNEFCPVLSITLLITKSMVTQKVCTVIQQPSSGLRTVWTEISVDRLCSSLTSQRDKSWNGFQSYRIVLEDEEFKWRFLAVECLDVFIMFSEKARDGQLSMNPFWCLPRILQTLPLVGIPFHVHGIKTNRPRETRIPCKCHWARKQTYCHSQSSTPQPLSTVIPSHFFLWLWNNGCHHSYYGS